MYSRKMIGAILITAIFLLTAVSGMVTACDISGTDVADSSSVEVTAVKYDSTQNNKIKVELSGLSGTSRWIGDAFVSNSKCAQIWTAAHIKAEGSGDTGYFYLTVDESAATYEYWGRGSYTVDVDGHIKSFKVYEVDLLPGTEPFAKRNDFVSEDSLPDYQLPSEHSWNTKSDGTGAVVTAPLSRTLFSAYNQLILYACEKSDITGMHIEPGLLVIRPESTGTMKAVFEPEGAHSDVTWSISDDIAKISPNGNILNITAGKEFGEATITATTTDGKFTATARLVVGIPVEDVELDIHEKTIGIEQTFTLHAKVIPEDATIKDVTWSSSDPNVASVDSKGNVRGLSEGIAAITVTTVDRGFTDECIVTVVNNVYEADADDGELTPEQETDIITWVADFRENYPDILPLVRINSDMESIKCTTHLLIETTKDGPGIGATFDFRFSNKSSIVMDADAIRAMKLIDGDTFKLVCEKTDDTYKKSVAVFEIHIEINGDKVEMKFDPERVVVRLPYELKDGQKAEYLEVWCADTEEKFDCTYSEGIVEFSTGHFSKYAVVYDDHSSSPDGEFPLWAIILIIILVIIVIAAIVYYIYRKKTA